MVVGTLEQSSATQAHIRPFHIARDLSDLATLLEIAFGPELAMTGSPMVRDLRQMALWGPMLWLGGVMTSLLTGYVWLEKGRLVGNVTVTPETDRPGVWTISNVAVLPEFQRRGIASQLMDVALEHIRARQGRRVLLQVRSDNEAALSLYRRRSFFTYDTQYEMDLARRSWPILMGPSWRGLRRVHYADGQAICQLVIDSTPVEVLRQHPVRPRQFRRGLGWHLQQMALLLSKGQQRQELLVVEGNTPVGYGALTTYLGHGPYELALYVLPQRRGAWELRLVDGLLRLGEGLPRQRVRAYVSASHPEAAEALHKLGFHTLRVLDQMALELPPNAR